MTPSAEKNKSLHAEQYKQIGLNIAFYRKLKGLTQLQLAEQIGIRKNISYPKATQVPQKYRLLF